MTTAITFESIKIACEKKSDDKFHYHNLFSAFMEYNDMQKQEKEQSIYLHPRMHESLHAHTTYVPVSPSSFLSSNLNLPLFNRQLQTHSFISKQAVDLAAFFNINLIILVNNRDDCSLSSLDKFNNQNAWSL